MAQRDEDAQLFAYVNGRKPRGAGAGDNQNEINDVFVLHRQDN
jgi:hypothetical protein